jgi:hypothetical protein
MYTFCASLVFFFCHGGFEGFLGEGSEEEFLVPTRTRTMVYHFSKKTGRARA